MTALAAKILGAKGAYRCPDDDGFVYLIYLDIHFAVAEEENKAKKEQITCGKHKKGFATFICEHLAAMPEQQWFSNSPAGDDRWPDAWCAKCEALFQEYGEWNEANESKTKITMVCHRCYEAFRSKKKAKFQ